MKKLVALFISVLMLLTVSAGFALEFKGTVTMPTLRTINWETDPDVVGTTSRQTFGASQAIAENDKYFFVVIGIKNHNFRDCSAVQIYEKETNTLLKTIAMVTTNAAWHCPVREIFVDGDTLYISWGNAVYNINNVALRATSSGYQAPLYAYDVSNVSADKELTSVRVDSGNVYKEDQLPYTMGGLAYLDEENGNLYTSKVTNKSSATRHYVVSSTADIEAKLKDSSNTVSQKKFYTTGLTMNATQFIYKDGWLFEVMQDNAGLVDITATDTLVTVETDEEGNEISRTVHNNMIYVYDMRNVELSSTTQDITNCLKGVYETTTTGDAVIRDIEVIGDTIYASTSEGIEVIPFDAVKAENATFPVELTRNENLLTGKGGAVDLDAVGSYLYAAFTGAEYFGSPNTTSSPGYGEVVIYDTNEAADGSVVAARADVKFGAYDVSVDTNRGVVYVMNDTHGPPSMTALSIDTIAPKFEKSFALGEQVTENVPHLTGVGNKDANSVLNGASWAATKGQLIAENDKYIFVAMSKPDYNASGAVEIYNKTDGTLVATLAEMADKALRWRNVRGLYVHDDVLYVTWGTAWNSGYANAYVDSSGLYMSPTKVYDVSNLTAGVAPTGIVINSSGQRVAKHAPFIRGNMSYLDKESDKFYISSVENGTYSYRTYFVYNTADIKAAVKAGSTSGLSAKKFSTGTLSKNAVSFMIKDGWLYELLQSKAGLFEYDCAETLVDSEGNALNNMVRVYDISETTFTSSADSVESCLRGIYKTTTAGNAVLRDIEVYGDTLYVSNPAGVDVVSLSDAKAEGVTSETYANLTKSTTLVGAGGANDLDVIGSYLCAAFEGAERFGSPNTTSSPGYGEVIVYNLAENANGSAVVGSQSVKFGAYDVAYNEKAGMMYVLNDTQGTPNMLTYSFFTPSIKFTEGGTVSYVPQVGIYDVTVSLKNADSVSGTIICALYDADNRLSDVVITKGAFSGEVTVAEGLELTENIAKVKVMYLSDINGIIKPLCEEIYTK